MYYTRDINSNEKLSLREAFPGWGFPNGIPSEEFLAENNIIKVEESTEVSENKIAVPIKPYLVEGVWKSYEVATRQSMPKVNAWTHTVTELDTPVIIDGVYTMWEVTEKSDNELLVNIREYRNWLLAMSDYTQASDYPNPVSNLSEWTDYRQALRDLPTTVDVHNPIYPTKPSNPSGPSIPNWFEPS